MRILYAEDERGLSEAVVDILAYHHYTVDAVYDGETALAYAQLEEYDGIILCLPNFGDENGASVAFRDVDVPILVQAYPDEDGKMDFAHRRDALCGKLAMCNVLRQMQIKYTLTKKFCVSPLSDDFAEELRVFAGTCRVVRGMKRVNIGAIGARTTAFKTVRCDEIAFQGKRINVETIDLALVFERMEKEMKVLAVGGEDDV